MVSNRVKTLCVVLAGSFMTTLDINIVNVALPKMATAFSVDMNTIQWVVTSYLLVISSLVLMFGRLADIKGKKNIYQTGFLIFSLGSLFCVFSKHITFLLFARIVQGIGASMMMSCNFGIITMVFPLSERGRAVGLLGTIVAVGTMAGPPLGGFLVGTFFWQCIFIINIPIGIAAYFAGRFFLPTENIGKSFKNFDLKGFILFTFSILPFFLALLKGGIYNLLFLPSLISFILFINHELKTSEPMLNLSLFRNRAFTSGILCAFISYLVIYFTNILQPFYLQHELLMPAQKAGLIMTVYPITAAVMAPLSGILCDKIGFKLPTLIGMAATSIGILLMSFLTLKSSIPSIMLSMAVLGCGYGLFQSPNSAAVMSSVPKDKLGISGSINSLTRNLGMTSGISISIAIFYSRVNSVTSLSKVNSVLFISSMNFVYKAGFLFALSGVLIAAIRFMKKGSAF